MNLPISIATSGDMNTMGISPLAMASGGYLNVVRIRTYVDGGNRKRVLDDDAEVLSIMERIFGVIT